MIDTNFIITYTNGLYITEPKNAPRYDEFRDMFSSGQLISKQWAVDELKKTKLVFDQHIIIVGSWFGTLGMMLRSKYPHVKLTMLDIDPRCRVFLDNIIYNYEDIFPITGDMYDYKYTQDVIINTSCEHISDVRKWLDLIPKGKIVLLQSNDFFRGEDHLNCVKSKEEFEEQTKLETVLYSGELITPMYTRFMIIGKT